MNRRLIAILVVTAIVLSGMALARPNGINGVNGKGATNGRHETVYYRLKPAPLAWADSKLHEMLEREFSRSARIELVNAVTKTNGLPIFPPDYTDNQAIFDWGTEVGARYVLIVDVDGEYIVTRKTFKLPLIFHRYETFGVVEGEIRLIDLERRRMLIADRFKVQKKSGEAFQATPDDNKNDPDLHIDAARKVRFFRELEDNAAAYIARRVGAYVRR